MPLPGKRRAQGISCYRVLWPVIHEVFLPYETYFTIMLNKFSLHNVYLLISSFKPRSFFSISIQRIFYVCAIKDQRVSKANNEDKILVKLTVFHEKVSQSKLTNAGKKVVRNLRVYYLFSEKQGFRA